MAVQASAITQYTDDVEDQAPLLPTVTMATSGAPLSRRLLMALACVALLVVGVCPYAAQSRRNDAVANTAEVGATNAETGIISLVGTHGKKDVAVGDALLANVTQALVMDDTDSKKDDTMLSVKKGEVVYVHNVSKKNGWTFVFTKSDQESGFVPSMVLNENSTLVQRNYTPAKKNAKGAVEVKAGDRVWLTGIKQAGKDWIYIVKPDTDTGLLTGFIPGWAVRNSSNSTANNSKSLANSTPSNAEEKASTKKTMSGDKKEKHNPK